MIHRYHLKYSLFLMGSGSLKQLFPKYARKLGLHKLDRPVLYVQDRGHVGTVVYFHSLPGDARQLGGLNYNFGGKRVIAPDYAAFPAIEPKDMAAMIDDLIPENDDIHIVANGLAAVPALVLANQLKQAKNIRSVQLITPFQIAANDAMGCLTAIRHNKYETNPLYHVKHEQVPEEEQVGEVLDDIIRSISSTDKNVSKQMAARRMADRTIFHPLFGGYSLFRQYAMEYLPFCRVGLLTRILARSTDLDKFNRGAYGEAKHLVKMVKAGVFDPHFGPDKDRASGIYALRSSRVESKRFDFEYMFSSKWDRLLAAIGCRPYSPVNTMIALKLYGFSGKKAADLMKRLKSTTEGKATFKMVVENRLNIPFLERRFSEPLQLPEGWEVEKDFQAYLKEEGDIAEGELRFYLKRLQEHYKSNDEAASIQKTPSQAVLQSPLNGLSQATATGLDTRGPRDLGEHEDMLHARHLDLQAEREEERRKKEIAEQHHFKPATQTPDASDKEGVEEVVPVDSFYVTGNSMPLLINKLQFEAWVEIGLQTADLEGLAGYEAKWDSIRQTLQSQQEEESAAASQNHDESDARDKDHK